MVTVAVSVVIPCYGHAEHLHGCLEALTAQLDAPPFEVIVVDNSPAPTIRSQDLPAGVILEHQPIPGSYAARNRGIESATAAVIAFTDADCIPRADWVSAIHRASEDHPGSILVGLVDLGAGRATTPYLYQSLLGFKQESYVSKGDFGATANLACPRELFDEVGPFDARLRSGGDAEWCQRAVRQFGVPLLLCRDIRVEHPPRGFMELIRKERRLAGGRRLRETHRAEASTVDDQKPRVGRVRAGRRRFLWLLRGPFSDATATIRELRRRGDSFNRHQAVRLWCLIALVQFVHRYERLRLRFGREPVR